MRRYEGALEQRFPARDPVAVAFILLLGLAALSVAIGLAAGVLEGPLYGVLIAMAALTTLAAPPVVTRLLGRGRRAGG